MNTTIAENRWEGGVSPYGQSWQKLMMWFFIIGDALLFGGFLASYGFTRDGSAAVVKWTLLTLVGGAIFLGCQAYEWSHLIGEGGRPWNNPWGDRSFGAYFFLITGFHGTHVLIGLIILLVTALSSKKATTIDPNGVEVAGLY